MQANGNYSTEAVQFGRVRTVVLGYFEKIIEAIENQPTKGIEKLRSR
jgi:hypothetical protein